MIEDFSGRNLISCGSTLPCSFRPLLVSPGVTPRSPHFAHLTVSPLASAVGPVRLSSLTFLSRPVVPTASGNEWRRNDTVSEESERKDDRNRRVETKDSY